MGYIRFFNSAERLKCGVKGDQRLSECLVNERPLCCSYRNSSGIYQTSFLETWPQLRPAGRCVRNPFCSGNQDALGQYLQITFPAIAYSVCKEQHLTPLLSPPF